MNICKNCVYYGQGGVCYYNPPVPLPNGVSIRPVVGEKERACGQFKKNSLRDNAMGGKVS